MFIAASQHQKIITLYGIAHHMKNIIIALTTFYLLPFSCSAQLVPDKFYARQIAVVDSLTRIKPRQQANVYQAADIYLSLSKKYEIVDPISFFYYSIYAEHADAFYNAGLLLIRGSGDSIKHIIRSYGNIYGANDLSVLEKEPLAAIVKQLQAAEGKEIANARLKLDWQWNLFIAALFKSNIEFRYIPTSYFKDKASRYKAMYETDSIHFEEFCEMVALRGFPYKKRLGINAQKIMAPLMHFTGLIDSSNSITTAYFMNKWKLLIPDLYSEAKTCQLDKIFYRRLHSDLKRQIGVVNTADLAFLRKYELE